MATTVIAPTTSPLDRTAQSADRLRTVLRVNASSSFLCGALMATFPSTTDDLLDTGHPGWIRLGGVGLMLFAIGVALVSTTDRRRLAAATPAILAGDVTWVAGSIATVLFGWYSGGGIVAVLALAAIVDTYAVLQWSALRHMR